MRLPKLQVSLFIILLALLVLPGCFLLPEIRDETEGWSANKLYTQAKEALNESDYDQAIRYFEILQGRYPFGRYAQQAYLDMGYAYYKFGEPDSAIATLDRFIRTYPRHPFVDYAYYLKGRANFDRTAGLLDRVLPRDPTKTDRGAGLQSFQDFSALVERFPDSKYSDDARQRMAFLRNSLAEYEIHVADFYMRRGAYVAAANRGRYVLENYSRAPAAEDALAIMTRAYIALDMRDLAQDAIRVLKLNHPESRHLSDLNAALASG